MKKLLLLLTVCGLVGAQSFAQNLLTNGDFESDAVADGAVANKTTSGITGWTIVGNVDLVGENVPGLPSANTTQFVDLNGNGGVATQLEIFQTFATTASASYTVSLNYAKNELAGAGRGADAFVKVGPTAGAWTGLQLAIPYYSTSGTLDTNTTSTLVKANTWGTTNFTFTASSTTTRISFHSSNPLPTGGILIDDVSVTAD